MSEELRRWNMEAVISTVDIKESPMGLYVKYIDIEPLLSECKKGLEECKIEVWQLLSTIINHTSSSGIKAQKCYDNINATLAKLEQAGVK